MTVFDTPEALALNQARMDHLASLELPINGKTVLDVGCGVGHLAQFFVNRYCWVSCVDARQENIKSLLNRYPNTSRHGVVAFVENIESARSLWDPPPFDIVFCYGLLYHLQNPLSALARMAGLTKEFLLLETVVLDSPDLLVKYEPEDKTNPNQAISGMGCRPTRALIRAKLREHFPYVYYPKSQPLHPDFAWQANRGLAVHPLDPQCQINGVNFRTVLIASRYRLSKVEEKGVYL
jgi:SAM-dependent methyltransferase